SSKASRATRTPSSIARASAAGASPACPGFSPKKYFLGGPSHPAEIGGEKHDQAEGNPVPRERPEVVRGDIADQPAHHHERRDERGDRADREDAGIGAGKERPVLPEVIGTRRNQRRH